MQGWNSIMCNLLGRDVEGFTTLKYTDNVDKQNVKGGGMYPIGRSQSNYEAEASITLYKEEVDAIRKSLPPGKRLQDIAPFDITVDYVNDEGVITRDRIRTCEFTNAGNEVSQGDGTIALEYKLIISHIEYNVI
ncbi:hypothetical protein [Flavobacterium sp. UMI-01]|uniref:hypothetical protein n=1 Tax=Flavobacterium sp. UMI-01 TaxID=1441053 RepID=UPI00210601C1|nr:hypothetical protein [Flavobacterium sp. UMI-01]